MVSSLNDGMPLQGRMSSPLCDDTMADAFDDKGQHYQDMDLEIENSPRYFELDTIRAENPEKYREGGYCPIDIGDEVIGRFTIVHKLGHGGFATVWLAREEARNRYVALKIVAASHSETYENLPSIASLLQRFPDLFLAELQRFYVDSPNGRHLCQAFPVLGPTLDALTNSNHRIYPEYVRKLSFQLVHAIDVMHVNDVCHGDLTTDNVALKLSKRLDSLSKKDIWAMFPPEQEKITLLHEYKPESPSRAPKYAVQSMDLTRLPAEYYSTELLILDFDQAYSTQNPTKSLLGIPPRYMAPESIFDLQNGPPADVWALGCLLFRMRCGLDIFADFEETPSNIVANMCGAVGRHLLEHWKFVNFNEGGWPVDREVEGGYQLVEFLDDCEFTHPTLWECMQEAIDPLRPETTEDDVGVLKLCRYLSPGTIQLGFMNQEWVSNNATPIGKKEVNCFYDLMSRIFEYDPGKRITTTEILDHLWFSGGYLSREGSNVEELPKVEVPVLAPEAPARGEVKQKGQDYELNQEMHGDSELQLQLEPTWTEVEQKGQVDNLKQETQVNGEQEVGSDHMGNSGYPGDDDLQPHGQPASLRCG